MKEKTMLFGSLVVILLVAGLFMLAEFEKENIELEQVTEEPVETDINPYADIETVDAKHYFIDGVHTLAGEMIMPTPCDLLRHEVSIAESYPEQVFIDFSVLNNADVCAQVLTPQRFKVEATASKEATFSAKLNGRSVKLNLIPAGEDEVPEDFEVFIKG